MRFFKRTGLGGETKFGGWEMPENAKDQIRVKNVKVKGVG